MSVGRRRVTGGRAKARTNLRIVRGSARDHWLAGLSVRKNARITVGRQLEAHLRRGICEGRLAPGSRLPSTRRLASRLPLHRNTVAAAYRRLARQGLVDVRQGRTARVVDVPGLGPDDGSAESALARGSARAGVGRRARITVVAAGQSRRRILVEELTRRLCGDVVVGALSPSVALSRTDRLLGELPVVELPYLGPLLPGLRRGAPVVALRCAPLEPVIAPVRHHPDEREITTVLTGCPRLRQDLQAMAAGLEELVSAPARGVSPGLLRCLAGDDGPVWADCLRLGEARMAARGREDRIRFLPLVSLSTVRLLQRLILAGDGR